MKKIKYIVYKILNAIIFRALSARLELEFTNTSKIILDLDHETTHFGDRLFLLDLIYSLKQSDVEVYLRDNDVKSQSLYQAFGVSLPFSKDKQALHIALKPMFLRLLSKVLYNNYVFVDNSRYVGPLSKEIAKDYSEKLDIQYYEYSPAQGSTDNRKYVLFSNYIDSGWFRKFFCDEGLLFDQCLKLKKDGVRVIHVGTALDKSNDPRDYAFVDEDWRGDTSIADMIELFRENKVYAVVTYDNFFLHLANLFSIPAYVLFRGRFTRNAKRHHFQSVNVALERATSHIEYLE